MVGLMAVQRPRRLAAQDELVDAEEQRTTDETVIEIGLEIARAVELDMNPGRFESGG